MSDFFFDFPSSYRNNFESRVVSRIVAKKEKLNIAAILIPVIFPIFLEYTDFLNSETDQILIISAVFFIIVLSTLFFIFADIFMVRLFSTFVDEGFKKEIKLFIKEVETRFKNLIIERENFNMKSVDEVEKYVREHSESNNDEYQYEDELKALTILDKFATKLRSEQFTLSDLQSFCNVENLVIIEDYSILDRLLELENEINSPTSNLLARFYHDNNLNFFDFQRLKEIAKQFIEFVIKGKGSRDDDRLNLAVCTWMLKTRNIIWTPYVIYADRMSVFIFDEFASYGTAYAAGLMEKICENGLQRKFEFYTAQDRSQSTPLIASGNVLDIGGKDVSLSMDDSRFGISNEATPATKLWDNMTVKMGFGSKKDCNIKVGVASGRGAVVIREYFTLPTGFCKWTFLGEGGRAYSKQEGLLVLIKSSTSLKVAKVADLSSSPYFAEFFRKSAKTEELDPEIVSRITLSSHNTS